MELWRQSPKRIVAPFPIDQMGLFTWLLALVTIQLALRHPAVTKGVWTPLWQLCVALVGLLVVALFFKAQAKLKDDHDDPMDQGGRIAKAL